MTISCSLIPVTSVALLCLIQGESKGTETKTVAKGPNVPMNSGGSNFLAYTLTTGVFIALAYVAYHNKRKVRCVSTIYALSVSLACLFQRKPLVSFHAVNQLFCMLLNTVIIHST